MTIDIQMIYLVLAVLAFMIILYVLAVKKLVNIKSRFTTFLLIIEELIGIVSFAYILSHLYKAMEDYDVFLEQYGSLEDKFTYMSIYFCASQIVILILIWIYKFIKRRSRLIKKRRVIK